MVGTLNPAKGMSEERHNSLTRDDGSRIFLRPLVFARFVLDELQHESLRGSHITYLSSVSQEI